MSVAILLRQRKQRKMGRKLGVSTDALLRTPSVKPPPQLTPRQNSAKIDYEMAKRQFTIVSNTSPKPIQVVQIPEPEEIEVETQSNSLRSSLLIHTCAPIENTFFQLPSSQKVTDDQLYEEFKRDYIARGVENAFWRRRRYHKWARQSRKGNAFK